MAGPAILLEIITYIFQCTPPTCECDEPLIFVIVHVDRVIIANFKQIKHSFNVIEKMMEYGIHCLPCFYTSDGMLLSP